MPGILPAGYYPGSEDPKEQVEKLKALIFSGIRQVLGLIEPAEYDIRSLNPRAPYASPHHQL